MYILDTCGAMICLYFGIAFLLFFMKIENTVYTSFQNSTLLFINGLIFDIMNIQNNQSLEFEWIPMLAPLRSVNDRRFSWLRNVFLKSFQDWLNSVQQCQGNFTKDAGQKMFISWQIYEGLKIGLNKSLKLPNFFFDIRLSMYWQNAFVKILSKTCLIGKDLWDRGKIIQVWLTLDITIMLLETKNISNQSLMVMLLKWHDCHNWRATSTRKPKKEWKFECISWIKKPNQLLFLPKYNKTQVNSLLNVSVLFLFFFISTLTNIRQINWEFLWPHQQGLLL